MAQRRNSDMAILDKENVAPPTSSDPLVRKDTALSPSPRKAGKKGRSKSIGPGSLEESAPPKLSSKDRRKSAFIPATRSILSKNEDTERAARRKTMVNRRVSFAPEATLHTWDIILDMAQEHTTSTDSADSTRRASGFEGESREDAAQEEEDRQLLSPPDSQHDGEQKSSRRRSGIPAIVESEFSESEESESNDGDEDAEGETDDDTGTAMSLDIDEATLQSHASSNESTGSSLDKRLAMASEQAGTRGIGFDEFGDMSMEIAENEITNAMQPWAEQNEVQKSGSAGHDQENINPFSPAFKAQSTTQKPGDDEDDVSMDVTRAVGRIMYAPKPSALQSSPISEGDGTMELTQAVGKITGQKRRRSTTETGSPGAAVVQPRSKRRRSSVARTSVGDESMDLTMAMGGIQGTNSPQKQDRRRSLRNRRSSDLASDSGDATMDVTRAVGGIKRVNATKEQDDSFDGNEELSMELTTVLGGIRGRESPAERPQQTTPQGQSSTRPFVNVTPKNQERFKNTRDLGAKQHLTPIFQKEAQKSAEKQRSSPKTQKSLSPMRLSASPGHRPSSDSAPLTKLNETLKQAAVLDPVVYPNVPAIEEIVSPIRTPTSSPKRRQSRRDVSSEQRQSDSQLQVPQQSPMTTEQQRSSPRRRAAVTPEKSKATEDTKNLTDTIRLMTTPRKETLKNATPKKQTTAKAATPSRPMTPRGRPTPKGSKTILPSPVRRLNEDLERIHANGEPTQNVGLQDFLAKANIKFMDLTTTRRRLTVAPPPSTTKSSQDIKEEVNLETGVVAAACTIPELELYQHACHELKRFTKEGKQVIAELEEETLQNQPPLIRAYVHAPQERKSALDVQMRDMKTYARLRSKEMWYTWRTQLLDELMSGLSKIGEGLIQDVEVLAESEEILDEALPPLAQQHQSLQREADELERASGAVTEEEKEELNVTRTNLKALQGNLVDKRKILEDLRKQVEEQDRFTDHLQESKVEFTAAIQEANRVREACRGVSVDEVTKIKGSVKQLEEDHGWSITSASSNPSTLTMTYRSELQLFFYPMAFNNDSDSPNAPISLVYIADKKPRAIKPLSTTLRFLLQLLRASLQGLPQCETKISTLLSLVSSGWDLASEIAETERRLNLETLTTASIVGDERLDIVADILLPKVKTKVRATFEVTATVSEDLTIGIDVEPQVMVVYGEQYNEENMTKFLGQSIGGGLEGWDEAVRGMREKLVAKGAKGARK